MAYTSGFMTERVLAPLEPPTVTSRPLLPPARCSVAHESTGVDHGSYASRDHCADAGLLVF